MAVNFDNYLGIHQQALAFREQRATTIAGNLANIDTPGYKAMDLDFSTALQQAQNNLNNAGTGLQSVLQQPDLVERLQSQPSADGNTVELGKEQAAWAENRSDWEASFTFINMKFRSLEKAITG